MNRRSQIYYCCSQNGVCFVPGTKTITCIRFQYTGFGYIYTEWIAGKRPVVDYRMQPGFVFFEHYV
jgi:hypothetical protein